MTRPCSPAACASTDWIMREKRISTSGRDGSRTTGWRDRTMSGRMAADGSRQTRLTMARSGAESFHEPIWAPDGSAILAIAGRALEDESQGLEGVAYDLAVLGTDGSLVRTITDSPDFDAQAHLSPDGTRLVFSSQRQTTASLPAAAASDAPAPAPMRRLSRTGGPQPGNPPGLGVQGGGASAAPGFRWDIYVANADGTGERRLTEGGTINIATAWAADGRILFHSDRDGDFDVYSMRADGSDVRQLTNDPGDDTWPAWAPDGRLAFTVEPRRHVRGLGRRGRWLRGAPADGRSGGRLDAGLVARRLDDRLPQRTRRDGRGLRDAERRRRGAQPQSNAQHGRAHHGRRLVARRLDHRLLVLADRDGGGLRLHGRSDPMRDTIGRCHRPGRPRAP